MSDWLSETLRPILGELSPLAYALVFLGGVLTSLGPCNLGMVPVIMAYVGGQGAVGRSKGFWLSLCFTLGSALTFVLLGIAAATAGWLVGANGQAILRWLVAVVCLAVGLNLLGTFRWNVSLGARLQPKRWALTGALGAFVLGLVVGVAGSQCGTPVLIAILGIVTIKGSLPYAASLLFAYGLGRGVPIVAAGTFTGALRALPALERWTGWMEKAAGVILIAIGLYFVWIA